MSTRLAVGDQAPPDFTLLDADEKPVSLADYRGRRVIVYFYPAASTPRLHQAGLRLPRQPRRTGRRRTRRHRHLPDKPAKLAKFRDKEGLTFPLLSDPDRAVLEAWGAFGEKKMYGKTVVGVIRSTFVVGPDGAIEEAQYNVRATGHVAKLRKDLKV